MNCKYSENSRSYKACGLCSDKNICEYSNVTDEVITLLSAKEAYEKAINNIKHCYTEELIEINKKITDAVMNGEFYIIINDDKLQYEIIQRLRELGYYLSTITQYPRPVWKISWN